MIEYYKNLSLENLFYTDEFGVLWEEEWRNILRYEKIYAISSFGRVKSLQRYILKKHCKVASLTKEIIMKQKFEKSGYLRVNFRKNPPFKESVIPHRLVAIAFIPNPDNLPQVNHKDENGTKWYNPVWNLEWNTAKENNDHAILNKLKSDSIGINHHNANLTEAQVLEIRNMPNSVKGVDIAKMYNMNPPAISKIRRGITWKHLL